MNCLYLLPAHHKLDINATNWKNLLNNNNISKLNDKRKLKKTKKDSIIAIMKWSWSKKKKKKKKEEEEESNNEMVIYALHTKIFNNSNNEMVIKQRIIMNWSSQLSHWVS